MIFVKEGKLAPAYNTLYVYDSKNIYEIYFRADRDVVNDFIQETGMYYNPCVMAYDMEYDQYGRDIPDIREVLDDWRRNGTIDDYFESVDYYGENIEYLIQNVGRVECTTPKSTGIYFPMDGVTDVLVASVLWNELAVPVKGVDTIYNMIYDPEYDKTTDDKIVLCKDGIVYPDSMRL